MLLHSASDAALDALVAIAADRPTPQCMLNFWALGGAIARVPPDATAFVHRDAGHMLSLDTTWTNPADTDRCIDWTRRTWSSLQEQFGIGAAYLNFVGFGEEKETLLRASFGDNYERLVELKTKFDPGNLFHMNANIPPRRLAEAAD